MLCISVTMMTIPHEGSGLPLPVLILPVMQAQRCFANLTTDSMAVGNLPAEFMTDMILFFLLSTSRARARIPR